MKGEKKNKGKEGKEKERKIKWVREPKNKIILVVIFLQSEQEDEARQNEVLRKAVDNIAWLARKNGRNQIVLHSFAHLSESKSSIEFAKAMIESIKEKLASKGFITSSTPFGYFLEFRIHVRGESLAKVWKAI